MGNLAKFAPAVFWAGIIVLALTLIVVVGGGTGPVRTEFMAIFGLVLIVLAGVMDPSATRKLLGTRTVRYGSNSLILTVAFLVILGLLNYLGGLPQFNYRKDFTSTQQFTLSPQTIQILANLKEPVKAQAFVSLESPGRKDTEDRLREYQVRSNGKFEYEFIDPISRPDLAQQANITFDGEVVLASKGRTQKSSSVGEADLTNTILKVTSDRDRVVYFITGHKERDPSDMGNEGYNEVKSILEKDNYSVRTLNLAISSTIPASATVVVLASPQSDLADQDVKTINDYLDQGGRMLVLSDPGRPDLKNILARWGISFNNDQAIDPQYLRGTSPFMPAVGQYPFSPISQKMTGALTAFPLARSLKLGDAAAPGITPQPVVQTTPASWGETNSDPNAQPTKDDKDTPGPLTLMALVEGNLTTPGITPTQKTRLVVVGNSQFAKSQAIQQLRGIAYNGDLFANAINWLAEEESQISIRQNPPDQRFLTMTQGQLQLVALLTILVVPASVLLGGLAIWWNRR